MFDDPIFTSVLFILGVISGALNSMGGSGGLVILTYMMGYGIPPAMALGTARLANIIPQIIAAYKFYKAGFVQTDMLPKLITIAIVGGTMGTVFIISIPEQYVYSIVGILLLLIAPLIVFNKNFGMETKEVSRKKKFWGYALFFIFTIYAGFFGAGGTTFIIFALVSLLGLKTIEAHSTSMVSWIAMSLVSSVVFILADQIDYSLLLIIMVSMGIGSFIGANISIKKGSRLINIFVSIFAFIMGLKLLFFP